MQEEKAETVVVLNSRTEAEIVRSKLEAYGIPAVIQADDEAGLHPGLSLTQGVRVLVAASAVERAKQVLSDQD